MYYLQSRYYDSELGRFINSDVYASTGQGILGNNMFVYCGNNAICFTDGKGTRYVAAEMYGGSSITTQRIANSPAEQISGMVNGQGNLPYSDMTFGLGSYARSGCALIAVYNAMQLIQQPQSLQVVTDEIFWEHGMIAFGAGGVAPWSLESYFTAHQVAFTGSYSSSDLLSNISDGNVIVFTILNNKHNIFKGWHAMTALYTNGSYWVFNRYNDSTNYMEYSSLDQAYSNGAWIYGILIDKTG